MAVVEESLSPMAPTQPAPSVSPVAPEMAVESPQEPTLTESPSAPLKVEIPLAWQRTKARIIGKGAPTVTESFREVWTLELRPGGALSLSSPRVRVPVYPGHSGAPRDQLPPTVVLSEADFARLVGIVPGRRGANDDIDPADAPGDSLDALKMVGRPITLNLARSTRNGVDVTLAWSEDEHYAVHLDVTGTAPLF